MKVAMVVLYVAAYLTVEAVRMYHRPKTQIDKLAAISGLIIVVDLSLRYAVRELRIINGMESKINDSSSMQHAAIATIFCTVRCHNIIVILLETGNPHLLSQTMLILLFLYRLNILSGN